MTSKTPSELLEALDLIRDAKGPRPESLDNLEARHVGRVRTIFQDRNIVAIGIAEKQTDGKGTGELGLCFYVEKKVAKSKMTPSKMVPPVLSVADRKAVFTDVQQIGKIRPQTNARRAPISSGFSVGNATDTGTLGAIVKKGKQYFLLSNSHVIAKSGKGKQGDKIYYPGDMDKKGAAQCIASLSNFAPFAKGDDFLNRVDAALAKIDSAFVGALDFEIHGAHAPYATIAAERGMKVVMRGRTSGESEGVVDDVHFSVVLPYDGVGKIGFIDQVKCSRYTKAGDSGSIVVDQKSGKIVGLHFAGSTNGSIFNPIDAVIKQYKFRFAAS